MIERDAAHQPVMLLVERIQDLGIGEDLVEALAGIQPRVTGESERELADGAELLHLRPALVQPRLAGDLPPGTAVPVTGGAPRRPPPPAPRAGAPPGRSAARRAGRAPVAR